MYLPMQIVIALPVMVVVILFNDVSAYDDLLESPVLLWLSLLAAALAGLLTLAVAWLWPALWRLIRQGSVPASEWLAWRRPRRIPLWAVLPVTLLALLLIGGGIGLLADQLGLGTTEISLQMQLFSTPALQAASIVIVSTIVPAAEELIFRGALYNALLRPAAPGLTGRRRHAAAFVVTSLAFASVHLLAGFETPASILQIVLLSAYLTALRTYTGSVTPSIVAHTVWNLAAAVGLTLANTLGL
jgi:membrane protease YdiL (CAAX protease family)